ncbi:BRO family protein [uncultured Gilliamella sp.]|uniref:BRO family protein n=1 Tax=uncultured Gilliamella sp. TaxID=1193505 RepID=UPI0025E236B0|nr:BRO family protein [uncultured Gilliamella sp.]
MTNQLMFHSTAVQPVNHNNQIWITSTELSKLLEYSDSKSVSILYNRNKDEFTSKMSEVIKLTTSKNLQKSVRIFSLRGAHLIAMFANTEIAKEVRK